ncbi:hypothetical protein QQ213_000231 [Vibrio vulnificus]|uniref:hypothetical protein n=1 Tax=Vibrio vulnificus TaxID=672 RepID=UPI00165D69AF|nr:hypothetical protein [Vibrio vulnificus]EGQ7692264.1 hypothetical protein [Vibrio vulnificus]EJB0231282.1 hypothetical protein [Vibrio vulnificus]EJO3995772.1 hypothetical protein [Vibrio vulnificus]ELG5189109.1 hypothetical protein [Vibrio vulnificus]ELS0750506.1 hypothetical protein [Vibrio vulnificus]
MLLDLVIKSVNNFQDDCLKLCEKHYPAVHNQGMNEHHLGLAFARRMQNTFKQFAHESVIEPLEKVDVGELPHQYRVTSEIGTVWVLSHHMVSAGKTCRDNLLADVTEWQSEYGFAIQPNDLLFLIGDHWISRSKTSRELLYWWMGELPDQINEYSEQGISLYTSDSQLTQSLESRFNISPCYLKFGHPLRRSGNKQMVRKYVQFYAVLQW